MDELKIKLAELVNEYMKLTPHTATADEVKHKIEIVTKAIQTTDDYNELTSKEKYAGERFARLMMSQFNNNRSLLEKLSEACRKIDKSKIPCSYGDDKRRGTHFYFEHIVLQLFEDIENGKIVLDGKNN